MAQKMKSVYWRLGALVVIGAIAWMQYQEKGSGPTRWEKEKSAKSNQSNQSNSQTAKRGRSTKKNSSHLKKTKQSDHYEVLKNCTLIPHKHNDGDSFHVRTPQGEDVELRLYYVDTPESSAKTYGHGANNFKRLAEQGREMGGMTQKQTIQIGQDAKRFVKSLLSKKKFKVTTRWEPVYSSARRYAFVTVEWRGKPRYLHELLVEKGLARIHTLGRALPDGTSYYQQKDHLKKLERAAKQKRLGAWRF